MKREIKFRGKRINNGEWVYGYLSEIFGKDSRRFTIDEAMHFDTDGNSLNVFEVCPETVGQFTDYYDKNRKEIYGGDIVGIEFFKSFFTDKDKKEIIKAEIVFHKGCFGVFIENLFEPLFLYNEYKSIEVIGNIHDNPELL